jgi:hypothetical protein
MLFFFCDPVKSRDAVKIRGLRTRKIKIDTQLPPRAQNALNRRIPLGLMVARNHMIYFYSEGPAFLTLLIDPSDPLQCGRLRSASIMCPRTIVMIADTWRGNCWNSNIFSESEGGCHGEGRSALRILRQKNPME